jgi:hypothetical protein
MPLGAIVEAAPSPATPMPPRATEEDAYRLTAPRLARVPQQAAPSPAVPKPLGAAEEEASRTVAPPPVAPIPTNPRLAVPRPTTPTPVVPQPTAPRRPRPLPPEGRGKLVRSKGDEPRPMEGTGMRDEED